MLVYIATRGDERGIARWRAIAAAVRAAGHVVTYDWTVDIKNKRARSVEKGARGVMEADVLIYDAPVERSEGAAYELGVHHAKRDLLKQHRPELKSPVASIVIGDARCLFAARSDYHVRTIEEAVAKLAELASDSR